MQTVARRTLLARAAAAVGIAGLLGPRAVAAKANLRFEVYRGSRRDFRWRLKSANGRIVATGGEGYKTKAACLAGIALIREGAAEAALEDLS